MPTVQLCEILLLLLLRAYIWNICTVARACFNAVIIAMIIANHNRCDLQKHSHFTVTMSDCVKFPHLQIAKRFNIYNIHTYIFWHNMTNARNMKLIGFKWLRKQCLYIYKKLLNHLIFSFIHYMNSLVILIVCMLRYQFLKYHHHDFYLLEHNHDRYHSII